MGERSGRSIAVGADDTHGLRVAPLPACRSQLLLAGILLTVIFVFLGLRLYHIQIARHADYSERVKRMLSAAEPKPGHRGDIITRDGALLAREVERFNVAIDPTGLEPDECRIIIDVAARELGLPDRTVRRLLDRLERDRLERERGADGERAPLRYLRLSRRVEREATERMRAALEARLRRQAMRWVIFNSAHWREYPKGTTLAPVLGWVSLGETDREIRGAAGLELSLDSYLASFDGHRVVLKDSAQKTRFVWTDDIDIRPVNGHDVVLTIDSRVQRIVEEELERGVRAQRARAGIALVMSCANADVLAMANFPSFDPNRVHRYSEAELARRRRNRAVESQYEPGSTIKPFWAAGAIEHRLLGPGDVIWEGGGITNILDRRVADVRDHGRLTLADAVVHSSNIGMSLVGLRLGRDQMIDILDRFGFNRPTGLMLPGEAAGERTAVSKWSDRYTTISVSFGFELSVTPIQLGAAYVSLVNGGTYFAPRLVESLRRGEQVHRFPVRRLRRAIRERTSRAIRGVLREVVEEGTGERFDIPELPWGGKTGTAALSKGRAGYRAGGTDYLSSFVAYAPHPDPEIVVLVVIERPREAHYGSTVCGPVIQSILTRVFRVSREAPP